MRGGCGKCIKYMAKKTNKRIKPVWENADTEALAKAFLVMKDVREMKEFLRDLLTEAEIVEFGHRFHAARMLAKDVHYNAISEDTGLSTRTIARVQHWRKKGMGGYRTVLSRLGKQTQ